VAIMPGRSRHANPLVHFRTLPLHKTDRLLANAAGIAHLPSTTLFDFYYQAGEGFLARHQNLVRDAGGHMGYVAGA
jgi:hypothetical protein